MSCWCVRVRVRARMRAGVRSYFAHQPRRVGVAATALQTVALVVSVFFTPFELAFNFHPRFDAEATPLVVWAFGDIIIVRGGVLPLSFRCPCLGSHSSLVVAACVRCVDHAGRRVLD